MRKVLCFVPWSIEKEVRSLMLSGNSSVSKHVSEYICNSNTEKIGK